VFFLVSATQATAADSFTAATWALFRLICLKANNGGRYSNVGHSSLHAALIFRQPARLPMNHAPLDRRIIWPPAHSLRSRAAWRCEKGCVSAMLVGLVGGKVGGWVFITSLPAPERSRPGRCNPGADFIIPTRTFGLEARVQKSWPLVRNAQYQTTQPPKIVCGVRSLALARHQPPTQ
jgi:hypothetical protein